MTTKTKPTIGLRLIGRPGKPPFSRWSPIQPREYVVVADCYYKYPDLNRHPYPTTETVSLHARQGGSFLAVRPVDEKDVRKDRLTIHYFGGTAYGRRRRERVTFLLTPDEVAEETARLRKRHDSALASYAEAQERNGTARFPDLTDADRAFVAEVTEGFDWFYLVAQSQVVSTDPDEWRAAQDEQEAQRRKDAEARRAKEKAYREAMDAVSDRLDALREREDVPEEVVALLESLRPRHLNRWGTPDVQQVSWEVFSNALYALEGVPDDEDHRSCDDCGKREHHDEAEGDWPDGICDDCRPMTMDEEREETLRRT